MKRVMKSVALTGTLVFTLAIGAWSLIAFTAGLRQADWQLSELLRQWLIATGMVKPTYTLVDFYTNIKGIEYLICVAFFVAFPLFYRYLNQDRRPVQTKK